MRIELTGHHMEITPALKKVATEKLEKLEHHGCNITSMHVVFRVEKLSHIAEATMHITKGEIHAHAESDNMYTTLDLLEEKLNRQLIKHKEKILDHRDHRDHRSTREHEQDYDDE